MALDTLGRLLALHLTPADGRDRAQVAMLCEAMHEAIGESVALIHADQGYTGEEESDEAAGRGTILILMLHNAAPILASACFSNGAGQWREPCQSDSRRRRK